MSTSSLPVAISITLAILEFWRRWPEDNIKDCRVTIYLLSKLNFAVSSKYQPAYPSLRKTSKTFLPDTVSITRIDVQNSRPSRIRKYLPSGLNESNHQLTSEQQGPHATSSSWFDSCTIIPVSRSIIFIRPQRPSAKNFPFGLNAATRISPPRNSRSFPTSLPLGTIAVCAKLPAADSSCAAHSTASASSRLILSSSSNASLTCSSRSLRNAGSSSLDLGGAAGKGQYPT